MSLRSFLRWDTAPPPPQRAFVGGVAVDESAVHWGLDNSNYQPPEYRDYTAISNGVYACVNVRASNLAGLPLRIYTVDGNGDRNEVTKGPLIALLRKVNPYWTLARLLNMTEQSMGVWGECFWALDGIRRGQPSEIWWLPADCVKVHPHKTEYISHFTYEPPGSGGRIRLERDDVVWFRYPNPANEYQGLSPLAAARIAADTASAAMHSNFNIFRNGMGAAGFITPDGDKQLTKDQVTDLAEMMDRRFRGVDKAHRMGVLSMPVSFKQVSMTPKDAEFLGALNWSLEDIARAYHVPIDKIGGKRTYQNVEESELVFWNDCLVPEARMIASEITEQLLPKFGANLVAEFDFTDIAVLQEDEKAKWEIWQAQITTGAKTINQYREEIGDDPLPWGDVWWAQSTLIPIDSNEKPAPVMPPGLAPGDSITAQDEDDDAIIEDAERIAALTAGNRSHRTMAYNSPEHRDHWRKHISKTEQWERRIADVTRDQMQRQKASVLAQLTQRGKRAEEDVAYDPFDKARWIKAFRVAVRPIMAGIVEEAGELAKDELGLAFSWTVTDPRVIQAIETQAQRFAVEVNDTTWNALRESLSEGLQAGESIDQMAGRVEAVMADRIRSSGETIARTETTRSSTTGTLESWRQSGVVTGKTWLAALDDRTRATHVEAHGQTVGIDEMFSVGACSGPGPGDTGCAGEDVNCRCSVIAVLDVEA